MRLRKLSALGSALILGWTLIIPKASAQQFEGPISQAVNQVMIDCMAKSKANEIKTGFLPSPPRDDAVAFRYRFRPIGPTRTSTSKINTMPGTQRKRRP